MTFGDFARNYLNPFFLFYRISMLVGAAGLLALGIVSLNHIALRAVLVLAGLWLGWKAIKPWGTGRGLSIAQMTEKMREIERR